MKFDIKGDDKEEFFKAVKDGVKEAFFKFLKESNKDWGSNQLFFDAVHSAIKYSFDEILPKQSELKDIYYSAIRDSNSGERI